MTALFLSFLLSVLHNINLLAGVQSSLLWDWHLDRIVILKIWVEQESQDLPAIKQILFLYTGIFRSQTQFSFYEIISCFIKSITITGAVPQIHFGIHVEWCGNGRFTVNSISLKFGHIQKMNMWGFIFFYKVLFYAIKTFDINEIKAFHFHLKFHGVRIHNTLMQSKFKKKNQSISFW